MQIPGSDPKLGRRFDPWPENPHPFISQGVQQIDSPHKKVGNTYNHQVGVIDNVAGIPGQDKDTASDDQAEDFYQAVEKQEVVKACQMSPSRKRAPYRKDEAMWEI